MSDFRIAFEGKIEGVGDNLLSDEGCDLASTAISQRGEELVEAEFRAHSTFPRIQPRSA